MGEWLYKSEKGDGGQGMYSEENVATHTEPIPKSLRQSELFTSLLQEAEGTMRLELTDRRRSPRDKSPKVRRKKKQLEDKTK
jgi:hypothetical protein